MIFDSYQLDVPIVKKGVGIWPGLDCRGSVEMQRFGENWGAKGI